MIDLAFLKHRASGPDLVESDARIDECRRSVGLPPNVSSEPHIGIGKGAFVLVSGLFIFASDAARVQCATLRPAQKQFQLVLQIIVFWEQSRASQLFENGTA